VLTASDDAFWFEARLPEFPLVLSFFFAICSAN